MKNGARIKILYWISTLLTCIYLVKLYFVKTGMTVYLLEYDLASDFAENKLWKSRAIVCVIVFLLFSLFNYLATTGKIKLRFEVLIKKPKEKRKTIYVTNFFRLLNILLVVVSIVGIGIGGKKGVIPKKNDLLWNGDKIVGHSFGEIDGYTYTGCLEAFEKKYDEGVRTFEVDFAWTSDEELVLRHDWKMEEGFQDFEPGYVPTKDEFINSKIYGEYTPLTYRQLLAIMKEHEDMWIVTDTKNSDPEKAREDFREIVRVAREEECEECLDRMIVQFYNEEMYYSIRNLYDFNAYIFTLYMRWDSSYDQYTEIVRWCAANDIHNITMWADSSKNEGILDYSKMYDMNIYVHTVNDDEEARALLYDGVKGIYTDTVNKEQLK